MGIPLADHRSQLNSRQPYDVAIAGGGLAGLSLSIQLARKGWRVALFEKEKYPFHKVCGEYISMESHAFLNSLGLPLESWHLPEIHQLLITAPDGIELQSPLETGGFGISRYKLDAALATIAKSSGVDLFENTRVQDIRFENGLHLIDSSAGLFQALVACACFGKKSNLDVKWKRSFLKYGRLQNYVGVKYHVSIPRPEGQIELHNFSDGYCGISRVEDGKSCLCYLTSAENLKNSHQSIPEMEENILKKNPALRKIFNAMTVLYKEPVTIAQISFAKKNQIENHTLCIGDAAGMITPLCGNGMSMALHGSKIAFESIQAFLAKEISRDQMEYEYQKIWNQLFASRLRTGRFIQRLFGNPFWTGLLINCMKPFPGLVKALIRKTHGAEF